MAWPSWLGFEDYLSRLAAVDYANTPATTAAPLPRLGANECLGQTLDAGKRVGPNDF